MGYAKDSEEEESMKTYTSLIIDIEKSRAYNVTDRNKIQDFMWECMECLNQAFQKAMEFSMTFSGGDEIQGLFHDTTAAVLYLRLFEIMMFPVKIRAGIGMGEWNIKLDPENGLPTMQDGPAYHKARYVIEEIHRTQMQRYSIVFEGKEEMANYLINASGVLKEQQSVMQNLTLLLMELLYPFAKKTALHLEPWMLGRLVDLKYHYSMEHKDFLTARKMTLQETNMLEIPQEDLLKVMEEVEINGIYTRGEEVLIKRNMSKCIADILACKRQNADKLIKRGHVIQIRNMDYMALQFLEKEYRRYGI